MSRWLVGASALLLALLPLSQAGAADAAAASTPEWAVQAGVSTLGVGLSLVSGLSARVQSRVSLQAGNLGYSFHADNSNGVRGDELRHHVKAHLRSAALLLDFFPSVASQFYVSTGLLYNDSRVRSRSICNNAGGCEVGDGATTVPPDAVIAGRYQFNKIAPYLGLGWGNPLQAAGWNWRAQAGVAYIGKADVRLDYQSSCGGLFVDADVCQQQVDQEARELERQVRRYRFYPLLQLSLTYAF